MDAEVLVAQKMSSSSRSNSAYSNGLRSRERPNKGMQVINNWINELMMIPANDLHCFLFLLQSNSLLHTVVVIYRFVVVFLDLASFWFK